jgi:hypothetical protein
MTEADWLACTDPTLMLKFLGDQASDRKLRLFACACCRGIWTLIVRESSRRAVEASEAYADGRIRRKDLADVRERARQEASDLAQWTAMAASRPKVAAAWVALLAHDAVYRQGIHSSYAPSSRPSPKECGFLRDIFGNPFRKAAVEPAWLAWSGGTVVRLAAAVYADRRFRDLPVLADALEEAGCTDAAILGHLREQGAVHVRGCHVLDLLLGKF